MNLPVILVVDDEDSLRWSLARAINDYGKILESRSGEEALKIIESQNIDLVITDIKMPGMSGIELVQRIRAMGKKCHVFVASSSLDPANRIALSSLGVAWMFEKPFSSSQIKKALQNVFGNSMAAYPLRTK